MENDFCDLKHSIHIFDETGKRLADIDKNGVRILNDKIRISVCKEIGEIEGWTKGKLVFASEGLLEAVKPKE